jgi:hypothetical protein
VLPSLLPLVCRPVEMVWVMAGPVCGATPYIEAAVSDAGRPTFVAPWRKISLDLSPSVARLRKIGAYAAAARR